MAATLAAFGSARVFAAPHGEGRAQRCRPPSTQAGARDTQAYARVVRLTDTASAAAMHLAWDSQTQGMAWVQAADGCRPPDALESGPEP